MLQNLPNDPVAAEFDNLSFDADERTCQDVAERLTPYVRALHAEHPELRDVNADAPGGARYAEHTAGKALKDHFLTSAFDAGKRSLLLGPWVA